ncbi:MAG TPA: sulfotransferase [Caulobacteraceae bacterium]|nr:sulfotransferase [Caulobacteraceae bacterium]
MTTDQDRLAQIDAAARSGDMATAARLAGDAIGANITHPLPYVVLAHVHQSSGRLDEAASLLARAVKIEPNDPHLATRLGGCLDAARRPKEALGAYDLALAKNAKFAPALEGKARVLMAEGRGDEARALFEAAIDSDPKYLAARMGLAHLAAERGDWPSAKAAAKDALAVQPNFPEALWLLAQAAMVEDDPRAAESVLRGLLADPRLTPFQRADTRLELGDALHAQARWREAFAAYVEGKSAQHALYAQRARSRERETARALRLAAWIDESGPESWSIDQRSNDPCRTHVFLIGFPRSGTTLLEQALAGHTDVVTLEEWPTLTNAAAGLYDEPRGIDALPAMDSQDLKARRRKYWDTVREATLDTKDRVFVDKQPGGGLHLALIRRLFPRAKIVFAVRDPRDVVLSCLRHSFQMNALTYEFTTLEGTADCYDAFMRVGDAARRRLGLDWFDLKHEDLVADFEGRLRALCDFLALDWHAALTEVAATAQSRAVRTPSGPQVRAGLTDTGVGRWRDYEKEMRPVLDKLAPWVERFGYA